VPKRQNGRVLWFVGAVLLLAALYLGACFAVARVSLRPPRAPLFLSPGLIGAPQTDGVVEGRQGLRLSAWWIDRDDPEFVAVLAHGYLVNRSEPVAIAAWLWRRGGACLVFDFPAHGGSPGREVGFGWDEREDVLGAFRAARERYPQGRLVFWGSSMGAAAGVFACAELEAACRPEAMILDHPFGRLTTAVDGWWQLIGGRRLAILLRPARWFAQALAGLDLDLDVADALRRCDGVRVLMVTGVRDTILPPAEAARLAAAHPGVEHMAFDGHHSEARFLYPDRYFAAIEGFLGLPGEAGHAR
jgi:pimeloyl-ACP methyl ester carboxylesterase